jgi:membrane associated rhomboid family serine protease/Tfp pilus assembly protein PilF
VRPGIVLGGTSRGSLQRKYPPRWTIVNGENEQSLISSIRSPESSAKTSDNYLTDPRKLSAYILIVANLVGLLVTLAYAAYMHGPDYPIADSFELEGLRRLGANYGPYTLDGQYWRVITSLFLHSGFWHFLINMLFLWRLGVLLDGIVGWQRTVAIYLVTGVFASIVSIYWHPTLISNGASGAIYGLAGVLISLVTFARDTLSRQQRRGILFWAVLWTPVGILSQVLSKHVDSASVLKVDMAAHIGGLVSGLIMGALVAWKFHVPARERTQYQRRILISSLTVFVVLFSFLTQLRGDVVELGRGERALDGNDPAGIEHIRNFVRRNPNDVIGHGELGYAYNLLGKCVEAEAEFRRVLQLQPDNPEAQYNLALIYTYCMHRPAEAVSLFRASLPQLSESSSRYFYFSAALDSIGRMQEAEEIARKALALDPKSARNHQLLGTILSHLGRDAEAADERKVAEQLRVSE